MRISLPDKWRVKPDGDDILIETRVGSIAMSVDQAMELGNALVSYALASVLRSIPETVEPPGIDTEA